MTKNFRKPYFTECGKKWKKNYSIKSPRFVCNFFRKRFPGKKILTRRWEDSSEICAHTSKIKEINFVAILLT